MSYAAVTLTHHRGRAVLSLRGEFDAHTVPGPDAFGGSGVDVVDCRDVTFMDARGITFLLDVTGRRPVDVMSSAPVRHLIVACGLEHHLRPIPPAPIDRPDEPLTSVG